MTRRICLTITSVLIIISFIPMTWICESELILWGEIRCLSLLGVKKLRSRNHLPVQEQGTKCFTSLWQEQSRSEGDQRLIPPTEQERTNGWQQWSQWKSAIERILRSYKVSEFKQVQVIASSKTVTFLYFSIETLEVNSLA